MAKLAKRVRSSKARSAKQRSALRKAQLASARKRHMHRKVKPTGLRRRKASVSATSKTRSNVSAYRKAATKSKVNSHRRRKIAAAVAVAGAAAGAAYVYKNRERLIVAPAAERKFVKIAEKKKGRKLKPGEKRHIKMRERRMHARRSVDAVRGRLEVRALARSTSARGKSLKPGSKNYFDKNIARNFSIDEQTVLFHSYRKDVNARARHRLARMKGKKTTGFGYNSGKQVRVMPNGKVVRQRW